MWCSKLASLRVVFLFFICFCSCCWRDISWVHLTYCLSKWNVFAKYFSVAPQCSVRVIDILSPGGLETKGKYCCYFTVDSVLKNNFNENMKQCSNVCFKLNGFCNLHGKHVCWGLISERVHTMGENRTQMSSTGCCIELFCITIAFASGFYC